MAGQLHADFLRTQDQKDCAIGVILSGTATDGTMGLEAIKGEGGITFAQDESAKYDSMPRSAVAAGCVDFVLSPETIAQELARIATHPLVAGGAHTARVPLESPRLEEKGRHKSKQPGPAGAAPARIHEARALPEQDGYKKILLLVRHHFAVDFSLYKLATIERRTRRRMVLNRQGSVDDYAKFLRGNAAELEALYSDLLINVTGFFRNPEAFETLKQKVFPKLIAERREEALRIWVPGCSTGQEAYSIAMAYTEFCDNTRRAPKLQMFATDLDEALLDKARAGLYAKTLVADLSPERLRRFFVQEDNGYRIRKPLRDAMVFARQNVLRDPPFSRLDLIACRNLLIYIEADLQKKLLPTLHYALKPGGCLFLGASESIGPFADLFEPADKKHKIYFKREGPTPAHLWGVHSPRLHVEPAPQSRKKSGGRPPRETDGRRVLPFESSPANVQREADRVALSRYAPASVLINADCQVLQFRGDTSAYLKPPSGHATFNVLKMARDGLMLPLRAALNQAKKENKAVRRENVRVPQDGKMRSVNFDVVPLKNLKERCYLIFFEEGKERGLQAASPSVIEERRRMEKPQAGRTSKRPEGRAPDATRPIAELERELSDTRDYLQSIQEQYEAANEELQAANEEVTSANEELQSTNEELETSKEELESTNEELTTVNEEMIRRNADLGHLNDDLVNFQGAANLTIVLVRNDLTIHRYSGRAARQFNLLPADIGRPITGIQHNLDVPDLEEIIADVTATMQEREREVQDKSGHWYSLRVRPYLSKERKVEGVVLVLHDIDALKRSAEEIAEAREYAEAIVRTGRDMLLVLDADLRVHSANDAFYQAFQSSPRETEGRLIYELGNGQWDLPKLRTLLEEIIPRNSFFADYEVTHDFDRLGRRTMLLNARMLTDPSGAPRRILLGIHDITEQLESEAKLRRSELRYRRLFESAKDGILILDCKTAKITDANPFMTDLLGYSREELLGKELWEIGLLRDREESEAAVRELQHHEIVRYDDLPLKTKSGQAQEVEMVANLYREDGDEVIQCNIRDITERKRNEEARTRLAAIVEFSEDAIISKDTRGIITSWNRGAEHLFGYSAQEAIGQPVTMLIPPERLDEEPGILERIHRGEALEHYETVRRRKDGTLLDISLTVSPIRDSEGHIIGASKIARDISQRKRNDEALRQAQAQLADRAAQLEEAVSERTGELLATNKQLEAFVYSIAHDLRAPLRSMQGFSAMLVEEEAAGLSENGRDFANRINRSAQFMDALLQDLLAFSRISQRPIDLAPVGLEAVVQSVLPRLEKEIQEKNARVESVGPWPIVRAHEPALGQVLFNLISNALKFTRPDVPPFIRVRAEAKDRFVRVWVEDNGIGIAPDYREQIFRLFIRLHGQKYPGTGIGLAIVQKGVERMGGRVGVESTPGQGSRFWFELREAEQKTNALTRQCR